MLNDTLKKSPGKYFLSIILMAIMTFGLPGLRNAVGSDLSSSYDLFRSDPASQEFVDRMLAGGATEAELENFLRSLDSVISESGEITEANFNSKMFAAIQEVLLWRSNQNVYLVLSTEFVPEIEAVMNNGVLPSSLVPLRNAVLNFVLYGDTSGGGGGAGGNSSAGGGGGGGAGSGGSSLLTDINKQISDGAAQVKLSLSGSSGKLTLTGEMLTAITNAGKDLQITAGGLVISVPPQAVTISNSQELVISAKALDSNTSGSCLSALSDDQELVGDVYEFFASTENSLSSVKFSKNLTITFTGIDTANLSDKQLDVFYYNESQNQWEPLSAQIDPAKKTAVFTTNHFSKYAVLAYAENPADTNTPLPPSSSGDKNFADLNGHWAKDKINTLVNLGIVSGVNANEFAPQREITRAEFATLLLKAIKLEPGVQYKGKFNDVPADSWYFSTVNAAAEAGLINGFGNDRFGPNDPVTREQMAVMIQKALAYKGQTSTLTEADVQNQLAVFNDRSQISSWAGNSIAAILKQNIISGRGNGILAPQDKATRAEAAVMILQMYNQL